MITTKLESYFGFAIKSGKVIFGYDKLFESKKIPSLVVICNTIGDKVYNKIIKYCDNHNIKHIKLEKILLSDLLKRDNVKLIAICDKNLSSVIIDELEMKNGK